MSEKTKRSKKYKEIEEQRVRYIVPKNEEISGSITKNWTDQAIRCYSSGHNCRECSISHANYSFVCQMKNVVKILLEQIGPPEESKVDKLLA